MKVAVICPDCSPSSDGDVPIRAVLREGELACWRCARTDIAVVEGQAQPAIERILLDLDGVLADWVASVAPLFDTTKKRLVDRWPRDVYDIAEVLGVSTNELWRRVHRGGSDFWANLEPLPWCTELVELCQSLAPTTILTSPSLDPMAAAGKTAWLQRHLGDSFRDYLIGPDKPACAHAGSLLIDDRDSGCSSFVAAGGHAIVFPQIWNSVWMSSSEAGDDPLRWVRANLEGFTFFGPDCHMCGNVGTIDGADVDYPCSAGCLWAQRRFGELPEAECSCYELTGGHQPGCVFNARARGEK